MLIISGQSAVYATTDPQHSQHITSVSNNSGMGGGPVEYGRSYTTDSYLRAKCVPIRDAQHQLVDTYLKMDMTIGCITSLLLLKTLHSLGRLLVGKQAVLLHQAASRISV